MPIKPSAVTACLLMRLAVLASGWLVQPLLAAAPTADQASQSVTSAPSDTALATLLARYRELHQHPELSRHESWTAAYLAGALRAQGMTVTEHLGHYRDGLAAEGVMAVLDNGPGPRILLRTELDALPVVEKTGLPYASQLRTMDDAGQTVGVAHACGHDIHITAVIGTVERLLAQRTQWHGTLMVVGQPAEEVLEDGARAMLADGVYDRFGRPDVVLAMHDVSDIAAGAVGVVSGPFKSSATDIDIVMRGIGGHGAKPEQTKDPVLMAGELIVLLQGIVSRQNNPQEAAVITVGKVSGGTKRNIIPEEVRLEISMRSFREEQRLAMIEAIRRTANGVAIAAGVPEDRLPVVTVSGYIPVTVNDAAIANRFRTVAQAEFGADHLVETRPSMASEDFGAWSLPDHSVPVFCFWLGASDPAKVQESERTGVPLPATHSPQFAPVAEPTLRTGVQALTALTLSLFEQWPERLAHRSGHGTGLPVSVAPSPSAGR